MTQVFPKKEGYELKSQLIRAARLITTNISEGFGKFHHQENIQFYRQARGSLTEALDYFNRSFGL